MKDRAGLKIKRDQECAKDIYGQKDNNTKTKTGLFSMRGFSQCDFHSCHLCGWRKNGSEQYSWPFSSLITTLIGLFGRHSSHNSLPVV